MRGGGKWTCENKVLPTSPHHVTSLRLNLIDCQESHSNPACEVIQEEEKTTAGCFPCRHTKKRKKVANGRPFSTRGSYFKKYLSRRACILFLRLGGITTGAATTGLVIGVAGGAAAAHKLDAMATTLQQFSDLLNSFSKLPANVTEIQSALVSNVDTILPTSSIWGYLKEAISGVLGGTQQISVVQPINVPSTTLAQACVASVAAVLGIAIAAVVL
ncbi:hypothetical protein [Anaplasma bovis]|uniref:hypothetical protein n=1 Tax=Anaplasma bovis TaxID=186733 RepID=UPI002FF0D34D